jgi:hypothetical protein
MLELAFDKESNPHRSSAVAGPPGSSTAPSPGAVRAYQVRRPKRAHDARRLDGIAWSGYESGEVRSPLSVTVACGAAIPRRRSAGREAPTGLRSTLDHRASSARPPTTEAAHAIAHDTPSFSPLATKPDNRVADNRTHKQGNQDVAVPG